MIYSTNNIKIKTNVLIRTQSIDKDHLIFQSSFNVNFVGILDNVKPNFSVYNAFDWTQSISWYDL